MLEPDNLGADVPVPTAPVVPTPAEPREPDHAFDESSVRDLATGRLYLGSTGPTPYEPPDPRCVCGAFWGEDGCEIEAGQRAAYERGKAETLELLAADSPEPDDLDRFLAEQMRDPEFVRAWWKTQRDEQERRIAAHKEAFERGKAEGRPSPADVAILRKLLMSLPYWPTEAFAALDRIEGVEPAEPETETPGA